MVDGAPVQATGTFDGCEADPAEVPSIDAAFTRAIELAGAGTFEYEADPLGERPIWFSASDRSVEQFVSVGGLSTNTAPTVSGWTDVADAATDARARWDATDRDYEITIRTGGGERSQFDVDATVVDGRVVDLAVNGEPADPASFSEPWQPLTVDDVFDLIERMRGDGNVVAAFDGTTGAPVALWFDPVSNAIDDELEVAETVTPS